MLNVLAVWENKGLFRVKSESDNVFHVVDSHFDSSTISLELKFRLENELFIISDLDDQRHVEYILEVFCKDEGKKKKKWD